MTDGTQPGRGSRRVDGVVVMLTTAVGYLVLLVYTAGLPYLLPSGLIASATGSGPISVVVPHILVPLAFIVLVRRPWWVRWLAAGLLLTNIGVAALLVLTTPSGVVTG